MVRAFCASGNHETIKCGVHGAVGVLAAMCAAYNFTAWCFRRDRHLSINAFVYSLAVVWEVKHTLHHLNACVPAHPQRDGTPADPEPGRRAFSSLEQQAA
jgi:hypothetical protein